MIEFDGLSKRFGVIDVLKDVTFTVPAHSLTAIVGTSGSGKSTLLRMVNRLVEPSAGMVRIDGRNIATIPPLELRRHIGYVIQNHGLFPHRTVVENIATVPQLLNWPRPRIAARVEELLALFQLDTGDLPNRYPHALSGGQQQRVGVARALAAAPNILLMDEPFGALDPIIRAKAQEDLKAIQARFGTTIVLVTHDVEEALYLGQQIAVMDQGRLLQHAPPAELLIQPATPFVEALIGAADKSFHLLSLTLLSAAVEPGTAEGPPLSAAVSLREALAALLWSRRTALPVINAQGEPIGRISLARLLRYAARPG
ncbi:MAG TPA: ABC transporter ATP-binding protein [Acidocella sp.]|jgi:osmoprotectant transport system ATP-binding protein|nr:ABC transporter ATP-binding protein [Acidocella sp.]